MLVVQTTQSSTVLVAIDIAKLRHEVLIEAPGWKSRKRLILLNTAVEFRRFADYLHSLKLPVRVGFEATGNYHRALAHFLISEGFHLELVPSLAVARTREAMHNSWDKNDPKDAQVLLHLLKTDVTQHYHDPLANHIQDFQELSLTYAQVSLEKTRTQHRLLTHYLPLYFPEIERHYHASRSEWLLELLRAYPTPASITRFSIEEFVKQAWPIVGRKVSKQRLLEDIYRTAQSSIGLPVEEDSEAIAMFRVVLGEMVRLCQLRDQLERRAALHLKDNADFQRLQQIPGIGPILALTILAEAGDLRRFSHHRQFLKFCGLDLSTQQSGQFRGTTKLSKYGNARLRCAFWMAATIAIRQTENSFRDKFERYLRRDPASADRKRMAYVAVAAKMARVTYGIIKTGTDYRCFHEAAAPSGRAASVGP
ncbi:MAG: IS110 family transposase [Bryobacteraceae bacterium]